MGSLRANVVCRQKNDSANARGGHVSEVAPVIKRIQTKLLAEL